MRNISKQKTKIALAIILTTFLSCRNVPEIDDQLQCSTFFVYETIGGSEYIDVENSVCFCRLYRWSPEYVGPIADTTEERNIKECDRLIGHDAVLSYPDVVNYYEAVRLFIHRNRKK